MRVIALADIHFKKGYDGKLSSLVDTIGEADALLLAGDLTHFGNESELDTVLNIVSRISKQIMAVPGNCDTTEIARLLKERGVSLESTAKIADSIAVQGLGGVPQWRKVDYGFTESQLAEFLQQGRAELDSLSAVSKPTAKILLTHVPPYYSQADRVMFMRHVGSKSLGEYIKENSFNLCVCGHIHECVGKSLFENTPLVNCGPARRGYYAEIIIQTNGAEDVADSPNNPAITVGGNGALISAEIKRDSSRFWG